MFYRTRRSFIQLCLAAAMLAPAAAQADDTYPSKPIEIIVPSKPGGSIDRLSRAMAPFLSEELGQPISIVNRPGGTGMLGHEVTLRAPDDGYTLLVSPTTFLIGYIAQDLVKFTLDDFAVINTQWVDYSVILVPQDSEYQTMDDLIKAIKAAPGKVSTAGLMLSDDQINLAVLMEQLGLKFEDVRFVAYQGGGEMRSSIAGGQVDFAIAGAEGSESIRDLVRPLAVYRDDPEEMWNAPSINEVLAKYNASVPYFPGSVRSFMTRASFRDTYPERWNTLVSAFQAVLSRDDVRVQLESAGIGADWLGPEASKKLVQETSEIITPQIRKISANK